MLDLPFSVLGQAVEVYEKTKHAAYAATVSTSLWGVQKLLSASKQLENVYNQPSR